MNRSTTDQLGRSVTITFPPARIISLVPSQTELLFELGLINEVIGITKFCVHPRDWRKTKAIVGGTKKVRHDLIAQLSPDLIIGNKEENTKEDIAELETKWPVWMSDVVDLDSAQQMIHALAVLTDRCEEGERIIHVIRQSLSRLPLFQPQRTLYLIWHNPWMAAGRNTFIHSMLTATGLVNAVEKVRYPTLSDSQLPDLDPDLILLSSEPFPFKEIHIQKLKALLPRAKIVRVDGEMFSWYGSRMRLAGRYFESLQIPPVIIG